MQILDLTLTTPELNLALDEALLDACEDDGQEPVLRFWEPQQYFVVLGYSNKLQSEVNVNSCHQNSVQVLRRASGGGTVLQGPGCLNYSLVLNLNSEKAFQSITATNTYIMEKHQKTLSQALKIPIEVRGITDLAINNIKFSGNAQRKKKRFLLFHGTFLYRFDIPLIEKYLSLPERQPDYRKHRKHSDFLMNLPTSTELLKETLRNSWKATTSFKDIPYKRTEALNKERYSTPEWNTKF